MLNNDGSYQQYYGDKYQPQLLVTSMFMMMMVLVLMLMMIMLTALLVMMMFVCHIFSLFLVSGCKVTTIFHNSVAIFQLSTIHHPLFSILLNQYLFYHNFLVSYDI